MTIFEEVYYNIGFYGKPFSSKIIN